jgi:hypothetical protein
MTIDNFKNYKEKEKFEKELVEFWKDEIRIRGGEIEDEEEKIKRMIILMHTTLIDSQTINVKRRTNRRRQAVCHQTSYH